MTYKAGCYIYLLNLSASFRKYETESILIARIVFQCAGMFVGWFPFGSITPDR